MTKWYNKTQLYLYFGMLIILCISTYLWYFRLHGVLLGYDDSVLLFQDADDHMMMTRVRDFFIHGSTSYSLLNRVNWPNGVDLYWTRLYDSILISFTWIFSLFIKPIETAVEIAGFCIAPVFRAISAWILFKTFSKVSLCGATLSVFMFLSHLNLTEIFSLGRPDHHAFFIMLELLFIRQMQRLIFNNTLKNQYIFGLLISLCTWASTEILPMLLLSEVVLFLASRQFSAKDFWNINLIAAIGVGIIIVFSTPIATISLMLLGCSVYLQHLNASKYVIIGLIALSFVTSLSKEAVYDEISMVHFGLYILACLYFRILQLLDNKKNRVSDVIVGTILGILFVSIYRNFFLGIEGNASEFLRNFWFPTIEDLTSALNMHRVEFNVIFWFQSCVFCIACYDKLRQLNYKNLSNNDLFWLAFIVLGIIWMIFSIMACRMVMMWYVLMIPVVVEMLKTNKIRKLIAIILIISPSALECALNTEGKIVTLSQVRSVMMAKNSKVNFLKQLDQLENIETIMTSPYLGPYVLYYTKHKVVAIPFHRQHEGLIASLIFCRWGDFYERLVIESLIKTRSTYILAEVNHRRNLEGMIFHGYLPNWITIEDSDQYNLVRLAKIDTKKIKNRQQALVAE
ncbi:MAG: hypothetical protein E7015_02375 [Alphaproteobacteria bacterium]|nr:hypothetical protein [Alphaproteobacteria bacterium]